MGTARLGRLLGSGKFSSVYQVDIDGVSCALKTFPDADSFGAELAAYRAIAAVPALDGRACRCYGVYDGADRLLHGPCYPRALCLELLPGTTLWDAFQTLPPAADRRQLQHHLRETLRLLHHRAGLYHGDIKEDNVFVCGTDARLLDFGASGLHSYTPKRRWDRRTQTDAALLDAIFADADSREASQAAAALTDYLRPDDAEQQRQLASLLSRMYPRHPERALLDRISMKIPLPSAALAYVLSTHLAAIHAESSALRILIAAMSRESPPPNLRRNMLALAAECASYVENYSYHPQGLPPTSSQASSLYQEAIAMTSDPDGCDSLRLQYARHLRRIGEHAEVVQLLGTLAASISTKPPKDGGAQGNQSQMASEVQDLARKTLRSVKDKDGLESEVKRVCGMLKTSGMIA